MTEIKNEKTNLTKRKNNQLNNVLQKQSKILNIQCTSFCDSLID